MEIKLVLSFLALMFIVCGIIFFWLKFTLISSTEGAVKRLNDEIATANAKQAELGRKLKEADEDLAKRRKEAKELANKMQNDAEEASKAEREKMINDARKDGEEIIAKAKGATEKLRKELEKEINIKSLNFGMTILNDILSDVAKGTLNSVLVTEFLKRLKDVDMSRISPDVKEVELATLSSLDDSIKSQFSEIIKSKLNRDLAVKVSIDDQLGGGVILKFGTMALDGSVRNLIREAGTVLQAQVEEE